MEGGRPGCWTGLGCEEDGCLAMTSRLHVSGKEPSVRPHGSPFSDGRSNEYGARPDTSPGPLATPSPAAEG
jgi:hypothetical protein